jgi:putative ABC transport system substrate-binding protein
MTNRRAFTLAALASVLAPPIAYTQGSKLARVGYLSIATTDLDRTWVEAFRDELHALGYAEGKNLAIEKRHAHGDAQKLPALVAELFALAPDVLVVYGAWHIPDKLRSATPVVFMVVPDPVAQGIVKSLARPEGNLTGFSDAHGELVPKRLQLLKEVAPSTSRVALLHFPSEMALMQVKIAHSAAPAQNITTLPVTITGPQPEQIDRAFAEMVKQRADAVLVIAEPTVAANRRRIAELAIRHRLPTISTVREFAESGFLMSYGTNFHHVWRRAAVYVDKILKGAKPSDLPVEQPTKFELVINLRTAKALALAVPRTLIARADDLID